MTTLVATLKSEFRRLSKNEIRKALRPLRRIQKQVQDLKLVSRDHRRMVARLERRILRLRERALATGNHLRPQGQGPRVSPELVQSLRNRFRMTRVEFAKLISVSPGSIFGWETGRTVPRGRSRSRLMEVKKLGVRKARAAVEGNKPHGRRGRRAG
jgi:DNA-binding transcriptional regulator YiaG